MDEKQPPSVFVKIQRAVCFGFQPLLSVTFSAWKLSVNGEGKFAPTKCHWSMDFLFIKSNYFFPLVFHVSPVTDNVTFSS